MRQLDIYEFLDMLEEAADQAAAEEANEKFNTASEQNKTDPEASTDSFVSSYLSEALASVDDPLDAVAIIDLAYKHSIPLYPVKKA